MPVQGAPDAIEPWAQKKKRNHPKKTTSGGIWGMFTHGQVKKQVSSKKNGHPGDQGEDPIPGPRTIFLSYLIKSKNLS
jgi:hypothetical protein